MKQIYFSIGQMENGQFASLTLCETDNKTGCYVPGPVNEAIVHDTFEDAIIYVTQLQKPLYFESFGCGYELTYLKNDSEEWFKLMDKWDVFTDEMFELVDKINAELSRPWYSKLWKRIKARF